MKRLNFLLVTALIFFSAGFINVTAVRGADTIDTIEWNTEDLDDEELLTPQELDILLAPIALYPDPLIAQILPAATFVNEVEEAARYLRRKGTSAKIDGKDWDVSVKAVAHYPNVLYMMVDKYDWTVTLGQAYIRQQQEVMDSIQRLRARAKAAGGLVSTPQQQVLVEDNAIRVVPAEPNIIYVPSYDPQYLYVDSYLPSYGFMTFGMGFTLGAWLNRDLDWRNHRIYYHGWRGNGWIHRSRPYLQRRGSNIYINRNHGYIDYNRRIMQNNNWRYRNDIRRNLHQRGALPPAGVPGGGIQQRNRFERRNYAPGVTAPRVAPAPAVQGAPPAGMRPRRGSGLPPSAPVPAPAPAPAPPAVAAPPPVTAPAPAAPAPAPAAPGGRGGRGGFERR